MNRALSRHIGLYRPFGYKPNKFYCFHTTDPNIHHNAINRVYNNPHFLEMVEVIGICGVTTTKNIVSYTKFSYPEYNSIHLKMVSMLDGEKCEYGKLKFWPVVTIENEDILNDLDKFIVENILDTKE